MKKKRNLGLFLNKQKISRLSKNDKQSIQGGIHGAVTCTVPCIATHCMPECGEPSIVRECIWSEGTDDITNIKDFQ